MKGNETEIKFRNEITPKTRVPISFVWFAIINTALLVGMWMDLRHRVDGSMTEKQAQDWIDDAREKNPQINWPRLPEKHVRSTEIVKIAQP